VHGLSTQMSAGCAAGLIRKCKLCYINYKCRSELDECNRKYGFIVIGLYSISGISASEAWIGASDGSVFHTTNAGTTWTLIPMPNPVTTFINVIHFFNQKFRFYNRRPCIIKLVLLTGQRMQDQLECIRYSGSFWFTWQDWIIHIGAIDTGISGFGTTLPP